MAVIYEAIPFAFVFGGITWCFYFAITDMVRNRKK